MVKVSAYVDGQHMDAGQAPRCEPLWRYEDLARVLPPERRDKLDDNSSKRRPAARFPLRYGAESRKAAWILLA